MVIYDPDIDGKTGITEESERYGDVRFPEPVPEDWLERLMLKQQEADHRCPKCSRLSSMTGVCNFCGTHWTPPLYG